MRRTLWVVVAVSVVVRASFAEEPKRQEAPPPPVGAKDIDTLIAALNDKKDEIEFWEERRVDADLAPLRACPQLQFLVPSKTEVTDAGLAHLGVLTQLQSLSLAKTEITDAGLARLKGLTRLQSLSLVGTNVTDAGLISLEAMTRLQTLKLPSHITDATVPFCHR